MESICKLARPSVLTLIRYSSARHENPSSGMRLDANENPVFREDGLNRYPEPQPQELRQTLAKLYGVKASQLLMTRGSDEGIDLLVRVFCEASQDSIVVTPPTYGMYEVAARIQGADVKEIPLIMTSGFALDKESLLGQWRLSMKLIFLCSPNNPTGNGLKVSDVFAICRQLQHQAIIVLDEAYVEFSTAPSLSRYVANYSNLVVLRTLSKAFGLAGLRLGSLIAHEDIIALLEKVMAPYPIPKLVAQVATASLLTTNRARMMSQIQSMRVEREKLRCYLESLSSVECVYPSEANFLLVKVNDSQRWLSWCAKNHIIIRSRHMMTGLSHCVRITIGTRQENERLQEVLANV